MKNKLVYSFEFRVYRETVKKGLIRFIFLLTLNFQLSTLKCFTSFPSLQIVGDAKSSGMGDSFIAVSDETSGLYFNPASAAFLDKNRILLTHLFYFEDIKYDNLTVVLPTMEHGVFGFGLSYLYTFAERRQSDTENPVGEFGFSDSFFVFSYSKKILKNISVGSSMKIIRETIETTKAKGFAMDFGLLLKVRTIHVLPLQLGFSILNLGPKIQFAEVEEKLPLSINYGTSLKIIKNAKLNISVDDKKSFKFGCEWWFEKMIAMRIGYNTENVSDLGEFSGFSFGNGLKLNNFGFDFAFQLYGILGNSYTLSATYGF